MVSAVGSIPTEERKGVIVLVDWENIFYRLVDIFKAELGLEFRLAKMMGWIQREAGELWGGYGFLFAPEHLNTIHQQICTNAGLRLILCPKRQLNEPKRHPKSLKMVNEEDTVDETIMSFGKQLALHTDARSVCLVSGDSDFIPFLEDLGAHGIQRALVVPTLTAISPFSIGTKYIRLADRSPITRRKMILRLDTLKQR